MLQRFVIFYCCYFFLCHLSYSQDTTALQFSREIKAAEMKGYLQVLASDSLEGRETGKPGQKKAANFISKQFQNFQLASPLNKNYLQDIYLSTSVNKGNNFEVNQKFFIYMKDYCYPAGMKDTTLQVDSIVFAGYG